MNDTVLGMNLQTMNDRSLTPQAVPLHVIHAHFHQQLTNQAEDRRILNTQPGRYHIYWWKMFINRFLLHSTSSNGTKTFSALDLVSHSTLCMLVKTTRIKHLISPNSPVGREAVTHPSKAWAHTSWPNGIISLVGTQNGLFLCRWASQGHSIHDWHVTPLITWENSVSNITAIV